MGYLLIENNFPTRRRTPHQLPKLCRTLISGFWNSYTASVQIVSQIQFKNLYVVADKLPGAHPRGGVDVMIFGYGGHEAVTQHGVFSLIREGKRRVLICPSSCRWILRCRLEAARGRGVGCTLDTEGQSLEIIDLALV